jgi:SAM-dependent methyltransferase
MFLFLRDELRIFDGPLRVLHFAPESSLEGRFREHPNLDYVSMDLHGRGAMVRGDITDIDAPDDSFDFILCSHVLEHVPDDRKAMRELVRVLRPDGRAVVVVPIKRDDTYEDPSITDPHERDRIFGRDHVRICGRDYRDRLSAAGFAVQEIDYAEGLAPEVLTRYGLHTGEPFYLCVKAHDRAEGHPQSAAVTSS